MGSPSKGVSMKNLNVGSGVPRGQYKRGDWVNVDFHDIKGTTQADMADLPFEDERSHAEQHDFSFDFLLHAVEIHIELNGETRLLPGFDFDGKR